MQRAGWNWKGLCYWYLLVGFTLVISQQTGDNCNEPSLLLTEAENQLLFRLMGKKQQSKAAAVVQMFHALSDGWTKYKTGVLFYVRDTSKKSYFIRLYDLMVG